MGPLVKPYLTKGFKILAEWAVLTVDWYSTTGYNEIIVTLKQTI